MTVPPPPQGQNPYAQTPTAPTGQPAGQPGVPPQQPGQPGVPPQGPYAPFPQQQGGPFPAPPAPPAPRKSKKALKVIGGIVVAVLIIGLKFGAGWGLGWLFGRDDAETTSVGSCMHNDGTQSSPDLQEVDCSSGKSQYKVVEKFGGSSDSSKCDNVKDATISYIQYGNGHDVVLCLKETS